MEWPTVFLALGAFLGATVSGVLGMGGGSMLLALMVALGLDPVVAIPVHAVVQLIANASRVVAFWSHIRWRPAFVLAVSALPGPLLGLWLIGQLESEAIKVLIGLAILYATWAPRWGLERLSDDVAFVVAGFVGGGLGVVVGAVGPLIAPFYLREGFSKEGLIGTKAVCQAYLHVLKIVAFSTIGFSFREHALLLAPLAVAVVVGTFTGKWLLSKISEPAFRRFYRIVLTLLAVRLLASPYIG